MGSDVVSLEELERLLESLAVAKLDSENRLQLAGCHEEAARIAAWRSGVRAAADVVHAWRVFVRREEITAR